MKIVISPEDIRNVLSKSCVVCFVLSDVGDSVNVQRSCFACCNIVRKLHGRPTNCLTLL